MRPVEPMSADDLRWANGVLIEEAERLTVALLNVRMHPEFAERIASEALEERR